MMVDPIFSGGFDLLLNWKRNIYLGRIGRSSGDSLLKEEAAGYCTMSGNNRGKSNRYYQICARRAFARAEIDNRTTGSNHPGCNVI
jgi:hypothetical protein